MAGSPRHSWTSGRSSTMSAHHVDAAALIVLGDPGAGLQTQEAVERQSVVPSQIRHVQAAAWPQAALQLDTPWVWLLDAGIVPEPSALDRLLDAGAHASPQPALLASRVLTPGGALDESARPVVEAMRPERVLEALEAGLLALRATRSGSLLLRADALVAPGMATRGMDLEWTARLLTRERGALVPGSVAIRVGDAPTGLAATNLASMLRLLGLLEPRERMWFLSHLGERAASSIRGRAGA